MERLEHLIGKLNEQFAENAEPAQLLLTTQLIEAELVRLSMPAASVSTASRIAVVMPGAQSRIGEPAPGNELPFEKEEKAAPNGRHHTPKKKEEKEKGGWLFNPMTEIPTLAHQPGNRELNESMREDDFSLNDKLKEEVVEIGHRLTDSPVRDLRKAIGINDRYVFVSELFRGDEVMYERSIKTINGFRILAEAEYWIERELKIKLGWDDGRESTTHFYRIVKRRFS